MDKNNVIEYFKNEVKKGIIKDAYITIISFMNSLKNNISKDNKTSSLYQGYLDMTYFAIFNEELNEMNLKIAIVYSHEFNKFEYWLSPKNRKFHDDLKLIHVKLINSIKGAYHDQYNLDSIFEISLDDKPNFNDLDVLRSNIISIIEDITKSIIEILK